MSQPSETCATSRATPVISAAAYTAGWCVGGLMTFANICSERQSLLLESVVVYDKSKQDANLDLILFSGMPTNLTGLTDKAVADVAPADLPLVLAVVQIRATNWITLNTAGIATVNSVGMAANCSSENIYGVLVNRGTPTYVSTSDISVLLGVLKD